MMLAQADFDAVEDQAKQPWTIMLPHPHLLSHTEKSLDFLHNFSILKIFFFLML